MAEIIIAIFIFILVGIVGINTVQAGKDYNSSKSNTFSVHLINEDIGNLLIREGIGGAEINRVTDALARGISDADLKALLIGIGVGEDGVQKVFIRLDELGTGDTPQSAPATGKIDIRDGNLGGAVSAPSAASPVPGKDYNTTRGHKEVSGLESETEIIEIKNGDDMTIRKRPGRIKYADITLERSAFHDTAMNAIRNIKSAVPEKRKNLIDELQTNRKTFQTEIVSMNLGIRENAKELRDNFRENVRAVIGHVDHGKTARIAVAHGKGLRMLNRFRSAAARFDHILGRLESRVEKLEAQGAPTDSFFDVFIEIEEAKNMSVENEAKMEELKAKYESLLLGENAGGIAEEARAIAQELKSEIENLHDKLQKISLAIAVAVTRNGVKL